MANNVSGGAVYELLLRRMNRRDILVGGGLVVTAGVAGCSSSEPPAGPGREPSVFATIEGSTEDRVIVPAGFTSEVLLRWGDPVVAGSAGIDWASVPAGSLLAPGAAARQSLAFGGSCDGMGVIPIDEDRLVICINHETPEMTRMFPGWRTALREQKSIEFVEQHPEIVAVMRASVGASVLEFARDGDRWRFVADSPLNRRVTADTPIEFAGPAARHPWLDGDETRNGQCLGTIGNCAAGATPWGTYLTAEENTNDFFGNADEAEFEPLLARANERFGMRSATSAYRWEVVDERFDHVRHPAESMKFGWIVEIDPLNPDRPVKKRTALGRFRHEGATTVLDRENRPVVYLGDDSSFEYFYKFVGDRSYDPAAPDATGELLDHGTLYVARLDDDGSGEWLPLVHGGHPELTEANGFHSQADVVLRCREAADLVGATALDRPEDVAVHPHDGRVYLACTQGTLRERAPTRTRQQAAAASAGSAANADGTTNAESPANANSPANADSPANAASTADVDVADDAGGAGGAEGSDGAGPRNAAVAANSAGAAGGADTSNAADAEAEGPSFPGVDAANPRGPNPYGHILEFTEAGGDAAARHFAWEVFILAGDPATRGLASVAIAGRLAPAVAYYAGRSDSAGLSAFANPDNLGFDAAGNLWIVTDGSQPNGNNNGCFVCPTEGPDRGLVRQFMSGPVGAEISGCTFSPDGETLFLSVQHPGSGSSIEEPSSHWPDGGDSQPRSSLIAIRRVDPLRRFYS